MEATLTRLQNWYAANCNGDWEHTYGVKIDNIDNPGWMLTVELTDTYLQDVEFSKVQIQRKDESDWIHCNTEESLFKGACGPHNLEELLLIFLEWAERHQPNDDT